MFGEEDIEMSGQFFRTELLFGSDTLEKLKNSHVAVFGVGGVGGFTVEALARSGVGKIDLIDNDKVSISNINRQIIALHSTVGQLKTEVMRQRILDINPEAEVSVSNCFFLPENANQFCFEKYDYIIDAVDTVTAKIELIVRAQKAGVSIISSMGAGNKLDPTKFKVSDIYNTSVCPLAKIMRRELKKREIKNLKVVYSDEKPLDIKMDTIEKYENVIKQSESADNLYKKKINASCAFVPSVAGLIIASEVIKDLLNNNIEL